MRRASHLRAFTALAVAALIAGGCSKSNGSPQASTTSAVNKSSSTEAPAPDFIDALCDGRARVTDLGHVDPPVSEASGIAASRTNPGIWWINNDSGDSARIFAVDESGRLRTTLQIEGARARDWEDIAVDRGIIYIADTGDNGLQRKNVRVYAVDEPKLDSSQMKATASAFTLTYPDGAHDAEALSIDPITGDLFIITKDWSLKGRSGVYRFPEFVGSTVGPDLELEKVGDVNGPPAMLVTGVDISGDGSLIAVRSYGAVDVYRRLKGQGVMSALESKPCSGPALSETQGEAIGFSPDASSFVTVSEGDSPVLHRTSG